MNLEEYKQETAKEYSKDMDGSFWNNNLSDDIIQENASLDFQKGFDKALELELPVKFAEWLANTATWRNGPEGSKWYSMKDTKRGELTTKELYQYWLNNILEL